MMRRIFILASCSTLVLVSAGLRSVGAGEKALHALAPAKYAAIANPYAGDASAREIGARIYAGNCAKCHEEDRQGRRIGPALNGPEIRNAAPGTLFWVLEKGDQRRGMPSYARFPEKYRWQIVTYLQNR